MFRGHHDFVLTADFSPDGTQVLTGSQDQTARLWQVRELYELFNKRNAYEKLSIGQKIEYGLIDYRDARRLMKENEIFSAAEHYLVTSDIIAHNQRMEYLNNALCLFRKLHRGNRMAGYIIGLMRTYDALMELSPSDKYREENEKLFHDLLSINDPEELRKGAVHFIEKINAEAEFVEKAGFGQKRVLILEKLLEEFPETGVEEQLSTACNNLSHDLLFTGEFEKALDYARKGLAVKEEDIIFTKLALALLYSQRIDEAVEVVAKYRDAEVLDMSFKDYILNKMAELEEAGVIHPEHERVTELIKNL